MTATPIASTRTHHTRMHTTQGQGQGQGQGQDTEETPQARHGSRCLPWSIYNIYPLNIFLNRTLTLS